MAAVPHRAQGVVAVKVEEQAVCLRNPGTGEEVIVEPGMLKFNKEGWGYYVQDSGHKFWLNSKYQKNMFESTNDKYIGNKGRVQYVHKALYENRQARLPEIQVGSQIVKFVVVMLSLPCMGQKAWWSIRVLQETFP